MTDERADIVVIGGGPAGIAAATVAAENGRSVLLVDEGRAPGGQVWRGRGDNAWLSRLRASGARVLPRTAIIDAQPELIGVRDDTLLRITADRAVIITTGARELFLPFPGWTLPGVVGAGGGQALLKSGWDVRGRNVVVAGTGPLLLPVAASFARAGARVRAVIEQASRATLFRFALGLWRSPIRALDAARYRAAFARYLTGTWVTRADQGSVSLSNGHTIPCDVLCIGYGLVPSTELPRLFGCETANDVVVVDEHQRTSVDNVYCAGEPTGIAGLDAALVQGEIAGLAAAGRAVPGRLLRARRAHSSFAAQLAQTFALRDEVLHICEPDTIVCRCEDVTHGALSSFTSVREAKLFTRAGMGACQGRICGAALRTMHGWQADSVKPPLLPVPIAALHRHENPNDSRV